MPGSGLTVQGPLVPRGHAETLRWLGIPLALPAHVIVSALLAGALAWFWSPRSTAVLLGILILSKEIVDLMIIALYEPVTWGYASGSVVDVLASIVGTCLGLWVGTRARGTLGSGRSDVKPGRDVP